MINHTLGTLFVNNKGNWSEFSEKQNPLEIRFGTTRGPCTISWTWFAWIVEGAWLCIGQVFRIGMLGIKTGTIIHLVGYKNTSDLIYIKLSEALLSCYRHRKQAYMFTHERNAFERSCFLTTVISKWHISSWQTNNDLPQDKHFISFIAIDPRWVTFAYILKYFLFSAVIGHADNAIIYLFYHYMLYTITKLNI